MHIIKQDWINIEKRFRLAQLFAKSNGGALSMPRRRILSSDPEQA